KTEIKFFEFGKIYNKIDNSYKEKYRLAILLSGNQSSENWTQPASKANFYTLKGMVAEIFQRLGLQKISEKPVSKPGYSDALSLEWEGKEIGVLGIIDKKILKLTDVSQEVFYAELNWDLILKIASEFKLSYQEISKFPAVDRDLALLIDKETLYSDLYNSAIKLNLNLLKSVELFDVYEGDKLPEGKKSYAMSFVLQNEEKTLSDVEIEQVMNELIRNFQENFNAELRN